MNNDESKIGVISNQLTALIPKMSDATKRQMHSLMSLLIVSMFFTMPFVPTASAEHMSYQVDKSIIDISGNATEGNVTKAGDIIHYQINVTNDEEFSTENVTVEDPLIILGEPTESIIDDNILGANETWTYYGNYTVNQSDLNSNGNGSGVINNTVSVTIDELDPINDSVEAPIIQNASYTIDKIVTDVAGNGPGANATAEGDIINYQIDLTNDGNIDLNNVTVDDPLVGTLPAPTGDDDQIEVLNVGETWTYFGNYTVTQDDLNSNGDGDGFINNTVIANCTEIDPINDSVAVPVQQNPGYSIDKIVTDVAGSGPGANATAEGDVISYQIDLTNDGNIDLHNVTVDDPLITLEAPIESLNEDAVLGVGEVWTYFGNYTVTQDDLNSNGDGDGFIDNTAVANCTELDPISDSATVPIEQNPGYSIDKIVFDVAGYGPEGNVTYEGDLISYQIDVTNDGNIDLNNVTVDDPLITLEAPIESLNEDGILGVGEIWTYFGNYTVTQDDMNNNGDGNGSINNTAIANCTEIDPISDSVAVPVHQNPGYSIDKIVIDVAGNGSEGNVTNAGDLISYQIDVTNDGNIDLTNVTVDDPLITLEAPIESLNEDNILGVGEIWTYFGNYTITQADMNNNGDGNGSINNTAIANCTELGPISSSAVVPVIQNPDYCFYKSVIEVDNGGDCIVNGAGDIIRYRVVVSNGGNVDLHNVTVNDTLTSLSGPTGDLVDPGVLNPGEIWKFYGNYTVTQADINNNGGGDGDIDNTATVLCDELKTKRCSVSQPIAQDTNNGNADLCIYKSAIGADNAGDCIINKAGDIIEYQVVAKNEGTVDLTGVSVSDPMVSLVGPVESKSADGVLSVGELWVYTGNYAVTQEDIDSNGGGDGCIDNTATAICNELSSSESSSIRVPVVIPKDTVEDPDSGSNNTTGDTDNNNGSGSGSSSGGSSGGSGIGTVRVISNTDENKVNESSVKENGTGTKTESEIKEVEENTQNETEVVEQQTENEENTGTKKGTPGFEMIYGVIGLLGVFLYRRK